MKAVSVGEVASVFNGKTPAKSEQRSAGHPVLKIRDINERGIFTGAYGSFVDPEMAEKYRHRWAVNGDTVILNAAHQSSHVASKSALLCADVAGSLLTGEWLVVRPSEKVDPAYIYYAMTSTPIKAALRDAVKGIHLYPRDVAQLKIPLLPLADQTRIAAILDQADALRNARSLTRTLLDHLAASVFIDMFGSFAGPYVSIEEVAVPERGSIRTGPFGSQLLHSEFVDEGIAVLGLDNVVGNAFTWGERRFVTPEKYRSLKRYTVHSGDVLVSIMGTCGRCVVVPPDIGTAINTKHICAITVDSRVALPDFVRAAFLWHPRSRRYLMQQTKGSIMDGLNMRIIKEMPMPLPDLAVQHDFVARMIAIDRLSPQTAESTDQLDDLFASLQSRAFSGQL